MNCNTTRGKGFIENNGGPMVLSTSLQNLDDTMAKVGESGTEIRGIQCQLLLKQEQNCRVRLERTTWLKEETGCSDCTNFINRQGQKFWTVIDRGWRNGGRHNCLKGDHSFKKKHWVIFIGSLINQLLHIVEWTWNLHSPCLHCLFIQWILWFWLIDFRGGSGYEVLKYQPASQITNLSRPWTREEKVFERQCAKRFDWCDEKMASKTMHLWSGMMSTHFKESNDMPMAIAQVKRLILKDLTDRYQGEQKEFLLKSTVLVPRFRSFPQLSKKGRKL